MTAGLSRSETLRPGLITVCRNRSQHWIVGGVSGVLRQVLSRTCYLWATARAQPPPSSFVGAAARRQAHSSLRTGVSEYTPDVGAPAPFPRPPTASDARRGSAVELEGRENVMRTVE